jgi:predicted permease
MQWLIFIYFLFAISYVAKLLSYWIQRMHNKKLQRGQLAAFRVSFPNMASYMMASYGHAHVRF